MSFSQEASHYSSSLRKLETVPERKCPEGISDAEAAAMPSLQGH